MLSEGYKNDLDSLLDTLDLQENSGISGLYLRNFQREGIRRSPRRSREPRQGTSIWPETKAKAQIFLNFLLIFPLHEVFFLPFRLRSIVYLHQITKVFPAGDGLPIQLYYLSTPRPPGSGPRLKCLSCIVPLTPPNEPKQKLNDVLCRLCSYASFNWCCVPCSTDPVEPEKVTSLSSLIKLHCTSNLRLD